MIRIHLRTGPRRVAEEKGRHAGKGEGISAYIHVANSHADRADDGRRSNCRHSANSLWEKVVCNGPIMCL